MCVSTGVWCVRVCTWMFFLLVLTGGGGGAVYEGLVGARRFLVDRRLGDVKVRSVRSEALAWARGVYATSDDWGLALGEVTRERSFLGLVGRFRGHDRGPSKHN